MHLCERNWNVKTIPKKFLNSELATHSSSSPFNVLFLERGYLKRTQNEPFIAMTNCLRSGREQEKLRGTRIFFPIQKCGTERGQFFGCISPSSPCQAHKLFFRRAAKIVRTRQDFSYFSSRKMHGERNREKGRTQLFVTRLIRPICKTRLSSPPFAVSHQFSRRTKRKEIERHETSADECTLTDHQ